MALNMKKNKKIILLTGGLGYIGSHTCIELVKKNYIPLIVDNYSNSYKSTLSRLNKIIGSNYFFEKGDICNKIFLRKIFNNYHIYGVIHFAALKSIPESFINPKKYYKTNVSGTKNLIKFCGDYKCNIFVFSSTAAMYSEKSKPPFDEKSPIHIKNPYSKTKYLAEKEIINYSKKNSNFKYIILRYFNPVGAHISGLILEKPKKNYGNLMPEICRAANSKNILKVYGDKYNTIDGTCVRDFIHIDDLVNGHIKALNHLLINKKNLTINLGTGSPTTVLEIINNFINVNRVNIKYKIFPARKGDVEISYANNKKAKQILNWMPEKNLQDICRSTWKAYNIKNNEK